MYIRQCCGNVGIVMMDYEQKKERLLNRMEELSCQDLTVAFSGGVDSSLLLRLACGYAAGGKRRIYAVTAQSELMPEQDLAVAEQVAGEAGAIHHILRLRELQEAGIRENSRDRCYLCKHYLFRRILEFSAEKGVKTVLEGTNEDDLHVYRPGIRAVRELGVLSPLAEAGLTKQEVRRMAAEYGISVAARPSAPCLATRFPYGTALSLRELKRVEKGEAYLRSLGFRNIRLRVYGCLVRIEVDAEALEGLLDRRLEAAAFLKKLGYQYVTLDLEGFRSGSMDID